MAADVERLREQAKRIEQLRREKERRDGRAITQETAAYEIGVSSRTYRTWEGSGATLKFDNLKALAAYYDTTTSYIERGLRDKPQTPDLSNGNGNGHATLDQVLAEVQALRDATKSRYDAVDTVLRTILGYWQAARGEKGLPTTVAEAQALLDWAQAQERTAPRSQDGEGRRAGSG